MDFVYLICYTDGVNLQGAKNKKETEVLALNTQTIATFDVMDEAALAGVEGGGCNPYAGAAAIVKGGIATATAGFITGGPLTAAIGWNASALGGTIGYYTTCWWH